MREDDSAEAGSPKDHAVPGAVDIQGPAELNSDLFYRMKLKLWDRDRATGMVRTPYDKVSPEDSSHWNVGTRVIVTEPGDMYENCAGRILEYRGRDVYSIMMENGCKASYAAFHFHRCSTQTGEPGRNLMLEGRGVILPAEASQGSQSAGTRGQTESNKEGQKEVLRHPQKGRAGGEDTSDKAGVKEKGGHGSSASMGSLSQLAPATRVRVVRAYGGGLLTADKVQSGVITSFQHGWYYLVLDGSQKQTWCRRHSLVVIGDADDTALGYSKGDKERKGGAEGEESGVACKKRARGVREEGDGADAGDDEVDDRRARLKTGKAEDGARAAGKGGGGLGRKAGKGGAVKEDTASAGEGRVDDKKTEEQRAAAEERRMAAEEKRRKEAQAREEKQRKEQEEERARQEAEANMTQEERDAREAARLAAMLNRCARYPSRTRLAGAGCLCLKFCGPPGIRGDGGRQHLSSTCLLSWCRLAPRRPTKSATFCRNLSQGRI